MKYIVLTKNTQQDTDTMNSYSGTSLLYSDPSFLIWQWSNAMQQEFNGAMGIGVEATVGVVGSLLINV